MPGDRGLVQETPDRLARRFLPRPPEHGQLAELFARIFRHRATRPGCRSPDDLFARLVALFGQVWRPRTTDGRRVALLCTGSPPSA